MGPALKHSMLICHALVVMIMVGGQVDAFVCASGLAPNAAMPAAAKPAQIVVTGHVAAVVLFVGFADSAGPATVPSWPSGFFDPARPGSFSHFYDTMSRGRMQVRGEVAPRAYRSAKPAAAFVADTHTEAGRCGSCLSTGGAPPATTTATSPGRVC